MKHTLVLGIMLARLLSGQAAPDWMERAGEPYTIEQLRELVSAAKLPSGAKLSDKANGFSSAMAAFSGPMSNAHTGFSLVLYTPKAWLGAKAAEAKKRFQPFDPGELPREDCLPVLRVLVHPDNPVYLTAFGTSAASSADHVVLRSLDKKRVVQPLWIGPTTEEISSGFGARASYYGVYAVFSMAELNRLRDASHSREFLVSVVGERKGSNKDFRVKPKFFRDLGD